ncbi:hypothetical protein MNBD_BACTEROID03-1655 [hydrothermal vent metagenome]|uniref:Uncharacterized protein n=1 Tax=hydrothermal vent metagenome TaxID=652676 RepID=A0A3B0SZ15_9ZZZZ
MLRKEINGKLNAIANLGIENLYHIVVSPTLLSEKRISEKTLIPVQIEEVGVRTIQLSLFD